VGEGRTGGRRRRSTRRPTATSSFGVGRRESHDASRFYDRFTAPTLSGDDQVVRSPIDEKPILGDARRMEEVETGSVALVVTSPPYFAGKEYEEALGDGHVPASYFEYLQMLTEVFAEAARTLEPGGRIAVNVANLGRKPYRSLSADVIGILQDELGLLLRGEVIWLKARGASGSCAWGSFQSPANPVLRDVTERIVIASKGRFDRAVSRKRRHTQGLPAEISVTKDEFIEATTDVWEIPAERATQVGHPAPFPVELPLRLIELYTYRDDLVLDPFMGSGSTGVAAVRSGRRFVGYDTESAYVEIAERRIRAESERRMRDENRQTGSARELARELLERSGFVDVVSDPRVEHGVDIAYAAKDGKGRLWYFDVAGAVTTTRTGLRRAETLWKVLGKAAVLHAARPENPFVVLTTDLPVAGSTGHRALATLRREEGDDGAVFDVVVLRSPEDAARLSGYAARGPG
jgi:DNA modification methylase